MSVEKITPILSVSSITHSFGWLEKLGWTRSFSWNGGGMIGEGVAAAASNEHGPADFGGVCQGNVVIFLCLGAQGSRGTIMPRNPARRWDRRRVDDGVGLVKTGSGRAAPNRRGPDDDYPASDRRAVGCS